MIEGDAERGDLSVRYEMKEVIRTALLGRPDDLNNPALSGSILKTFNVGL